jgi:hypothetical protein
MYPDEKRKVSPLRFAAVGMTGVLAAVKKSRAHAKPTAKSQQPKA